MKGGDPVLAFKKMAMRSLHLNKESGSSFRFFPLFVLTELWWNILTGQIFLLVFYARFPSFIK